MGVPVLIIGESGSGKSTSLRNLDPKTTGIFNVAGKALPFRGGKDFKIVNNPNYEGITVCLQRNALTRYVIDDSQYLMAFDFFNKAFEKGYDKYTEMGVKFYSLIRTALATSDDTIVYFLHHTESNGDKVKAKTIGRMLDEKLTVEGLFPIVLMAVCENGEYFFQTQNGGNSTAKSPMGMFSELKIPNDLNEVDKIIREYNDMGGTNND